MDFKVFKMAVARQFERMKKHDLFRTNVEKDELWNTYLGSFPVGSNPVYKERTEHDCNTCKQFIRAVGNVVAVIDGQVESIWDVKLTNEPEYQAVADAMAALVKGRNIQDIFLHYEPVAGTDKSFQQMLDGVITWNHFFVNIPPACVVKGADIPSKLSIARSSAGVLSRALTEITDDAVDTVLELIAQRSLYRGDDHKYAVTEFKKLKTAFKKAGNKDAFVWNVLKTVPGSVSGIRNTSIGTLLVDLSIGKELDAAVSTFEAMMAPTNYKRPTALVTKAMIEKARQTIEELGLTSALERRYATLNDITINNILYADRSAKSVITGDVFDELVTASAVNAKSFDKIEQVSIDKFITDILPRAESIEVFVDNSHAGNFVSLIAPVDPTAGGLFSWPNNFSWSYNGDLADSIKERVKKAGGNVTGDLCCRLAWDYEDDLDFHMQEPDGGHIYFGNRRQVSRCGGMLDVDANGIDGIRENPVENIFYENRRKMREGVYTLKVHNYSRRSSGNGFEVEIEVDCQVHRMNYEKAVRQGDYIEVATIRYSHAKGFVINPSLPSTQSSRTIWSVATQNFHKVNVMMLSPNFWDGHGVGNKHYFFMLEGCRNDGQARGFFNEFLKGELVPHRKVFEMVGAKMKTAESSEQLSGLGFSVSQKNTLVCRVKGSFSRVIKIVF